MVLDFREVRVRFGCHVFHAELATERVACPFTPGRIEGRWAVDAGLVVTAVSWIDS